MGLNMQSKQSRTSGFLAYKEPDPCIKEGMTVDTCRYNPLLGCDCGCYPSARDLENMKDNPEWTEEDFKKAVRFKDVV